MSDRWCGDAAAVAAITFDVDAETPFLSARHGRIEALRHIEAAREGGDVDFARCRDVAEAAYTGPDLPVRTPQPPTVDPLVYPD